jgi:hypothetical protein
MAPQDIKLTGFELLELLGQGGMGVVWKARQLSLDRLVAIKLLPANIGHNPDSIKQIMTEARTAAKLKHSGIVQVYDASEEHGHYFFVMEFVNGYNVGKWLARVKMLPWKEALVVAESVALALDYAWEYSGMIHCDIKPENIMVDQDGTIKVADLGLSRTRESGDDNETNEITGTPSYMSPEQVRGDESLDCRTDIYSLGATIYQMVTGRRMFMEKQDREIMDSMLTQQVPDPRDIVPNIPGNVCALLERMLSKDREDRPEDWKAVLKAIHHVEKGLMPPFQVTTTATSTMMCRKIAVVKKSRSVPDASAPNRRSQAALWILILFGGLAALFWFIYLRVPEGGISRFEALFMTLSRPVAAPTNQNAAQEFFDAARLWADEHPRQYEVARLRFQGVLNTFPETPQAAMALREMKGLAERAEADRQVWAEMTNRVQRLVSQGQVEKAINELESYRGPRAEETAPVRAHWAQNLRQQHDGQMRAKAEEGNWVRLIDGASCLIMTGRWMAAQQAVSNALAGNQFTVHKTELEGVNAILKSSARLGNPIIQSFQKDIGETVSLKMVRGERVVRIIGVAGEKIVAESTTAKVQGFIDLNELAREERLARLGTAATPDEALVKGVAAADLGAFPEAKAFLAATGPVLSGPLLKKLQDLKAVPTSEGAERELGGMLRQAGLPVGPYDEKKWSAAIRAARLTREQAVQLGEQRDKYLEAFGSTEFVLHSTPVLLLLDQACQQALEAPAIINEIKKQDPVVVEDGMNGSVQDAFLKKNPSLRADQVRAQNGIEGSGLLIISENAVDLSPLAGHPEIRCLRVESMGAQRIPLDIKPLAGTGVLELRLKGHVIKDMGALSGLPLKRLSIPRTAGVGFAPLEGLPLVELDVSGTTIRDLNALRGMRLESLNIDDTKVASLMMLSGMPLRELSARGAPIRDIGVLKSLPLEVLNLAQTLAFDYQALRGLNLKRLNLEGTKIRDVAFCKGMPLRELILDNTPLADISALRGMSMDLLVLAQTPLKDISPLSGSSFGTLDLTGLHIIHRELAAVLSQVTVTNLNVAETDMSTLRFLSGKKLMSLNLRGTRIGDLSPLKGMPLQVLNIQNTKVNNFGPLRNIPVRELWMTGEGPEIINVINECPTLRAVNGRSVQSWRDFQ